MIAKQIAEEVLRYDFVDGDAPSPRYIKPFELIIAQFHKLKIHFKIVFEDVKLIF